MASACKIVFESGVHGFLGGTIYSRGMFLSGIIVLVATTYLYLLQGRFVLAASTLLYLLQPP